MKLRYGIKLWLLLIAFIAWGCSTKQKSDNNGSDAPGTVAQVQVTQVSYRTLADTLNVNGQVMEGQQFTVRAPVTGYVAKLYVRPGEQVRAGRPLFSIRTREQTVLAQDSSGNSLPQPSAVIVRAPVDGQIATVSTGDGIYVAEGSNMATLNSKNNLYLEAYIPAQWSNKVQPGDSALVEWADGRKKWAKVGSRLAQADSQSQSVLFMINNIPSDRLLPGERLAVWIPVNKMIDAQVLPKDAVLTDESMSSWWVMKMINDSVAVRVPVTPGISAGNWMAVLKPKFEKSDQILIQGNYGLADTARVKVVNP